MLEIFVFFSNSRKKHFISQKLGSNIDYIRVYYTLLPGVRREKGTKECRFGFGFVLCMILFVLRTITPFIDSSRASRQPNTMLLKYILHLLLSLPNDIFRRFKKQAPNIVAKFPKVRLCESQTPRPLLLGFPSMHPLLMAGVCE
jgi:hypothetical protein